MELKALIRFSNINELSDFLISNFGFRSKIHDEKRIDLIIDNFLEFHLYDVRSINEYTMSFLNDNKLEDPTLFYQIVDLKDFDIEIEIIKNIFLSHNLFKENILEIFKKISKSMPLEVILNFNDTDFYMFKNGVLELTLTDYR